MAKKVKNIKIHETFGDKMLNLFTAIILVLVTIIVGYPLVYVISCSVSSTDALQAGKVFLWPVDMSTEAYRFVFAYRQVWVGFRNSILYCICEIFGSTSLLCVG